MAPVKGPIKSASKAVNPRISVNKLAEYLEAIPTRRKQIVKDAKYPANFKVTRYKDAKDTIKDYFTNNRDEDYVLGVIDGLTNIEDFDSEFQQQDTALSIECLESLLDSDLIALDGLNIELYTEENKLVNISGVDISVNPDFKVTKTISGIVNVGTIKYHISKTNSLNEETQKIVAIMLYNYTKSYILEGGDEANIKLCFSYDLFNKSIGICPSSYKHRMKKIEAACEEISLWWDKL